MKGKVIKFNLVGGILVLILIITLIIGLSISIPKLFKNENENDNNANNTETEESYESNNSSELKNNSIGETVNSFKKGKEVLENVNFNMYYDPEKFTPERNTENVSIIAYNNNTSTAIMVETRIGDYEEYVSKLREIEQLEMSELIIDNTTVLKEITDINNRIQHKYYIPINDEKYLIVILECELEQEEFLPEMEKMIESIDIL